MQKKSQVFNVIQCIPKQKTNPIHFKRKSICQRQKYGVSYWWVEIIIE